MEIRNEMVDFIEVENEDVVIFAMVLADSRIHVKVFVILIENTKEVQD